MSSIRAILFLALALMHRALTAIGSIPVRGEEPALVTAEDTDQRLWSVTTIIGSCDKPALVPWAAKQTAAAAIDDVAVWQSRLRNEGRDSAMKYLTNARFRRKGQRSATELGTAVHKAAETKVIEGEFSREQRLDDELGPFLRQIDRFLEEMAPAYTAAEVTVFSPTYGYAGTADAFVELQGTPLIVDYKTTREDYDFKGALRRPYPDVALQASAYRYAELAAVWRARQAEQNKRRYYLLSPSERALAVPVPPVEGGVAVLITPTRYAAHPVRCDAEVWEVFLHVLEGAARFAFELGDSLVANALIPPHAFDVDPDDDPFAGLPTE